MGILEGFSSEMGMGFHYGGGDWVLLGEFWDCCSGSESGDGIGR